MTPHPRYPARAALALVAALVLPAAIQAGDVNTSTQKSTDFEDGNITPFSVCTTKSPNYVQPFTKNGAKCAKFYWTQTGYDGTRMTKGVEACSDLNIYKEGWYAFKIFVPSSGFPYNKTTTVGQIFAEGGCSSWAAMFELKNNELWIEHRTGCVTSVQARIAASIPRETWVRLVCRFVVSSQGAGRLDVWWNGAAQGSPTYSKTNINLAAGEWTGDTLRSDGDYGLFGSDLDNMIRLKLGMYCWDTDNYTVGESRVLYYDNVVHINGNPANAWSLCNQ